MYNVTPALPRYQQTWNVRIVFGLFGAAWSSARSPTNRTAIEDSTLGALVTKERAHLMHSASGNFYQNLC